MKDGDLPSLVPHRNPITYGAHRRQTFWQIYFPLTLFILIVFGLAGMVIFADANGKSVWADISIIYLSVFVMLVALLFLAFITTTAYFLHQGLKILPYKTLQAQAFFFKLERKARAISNQSVEPILRLSSYKASAQALFRRFR